MMGNYYVVKDMDLENVIMKKHQDKNYFMKDSGLMVTKKEKDY